MHTVFGEWVSKPVNPSPRAQNYNTRMRVHVLRRVAAVINGINNVVRRGTRAAAFILSLSLLTMPKLPQSSIQRQNNHNITRLA